MAKTIEQLKAQSAEVKNATVVGENTATRVGALFTDIVEHVEKYEAGQTANTEANTLAISNEAQARAKADEQLNTAIVAEKNRAEAAELANATAIKTEKKRATTAEANIKLEVAKKIDATNFNYQLQKKADKDDITASLIALENKIGERTEITGNVVNNPDEEDLTQRDNKIMLKDRAYEPLNYSGKGYKILRKNMAVINIPSATITVISAPTTDGYISVIVDGVEMHISVTSADSIYDLCEKIASEITVRFDKFTVTYTDTTVELTGNYEFTISDVAISAVDTGATFGSTINEKIQKNVNLLTQDMITEENTIYVIRYDHELNNGSIKIPEDCVLKFDGGSLRNGIVDMSLGYVIKLPLSSYGCVYNYLEPKKDYINLIWFYNNTDTDYTNAMRRAIEVAHNSDRTIFIPNGFYQIVGCKIPYDNIVIKGESKNNCVVFNNTWGTPCFVSDNDNIEISDIFFSATSHISAIHTTTPDKDNGRSAILAKGENCTFHDLIGDEIQAIVFLGGDFLDAGITKKGNVCYNIECRKIQWGVCAIQQEGLIIHDVFGTYYTFSTTDYESGGNPGHLVYLSGIATKLNKNAFIYNIQCFGGKGGGAISMKCVINGHIKNIYSINASLGGIDSSKNVIAENLTCINNNTYRHALSVGDSKGVNSEEERLIPSCNFNTIVKNLFVSGGYSVVRCADYGIMKLENCTIIADETTQIYNSGYVGIDSNCYAEISDLRVSTVDSSPYTALNFSGAGTINGYLLTRGKNKILPKLSDNVTAVNNQPFSLNNYIPTINSFVDATYREQTDRLIFDKNTETFIRINSDKGKQMLLQNLIWVSGISYRVISITNSSENAIAVRCPDKPASIVVTSNVDISYISLLAGKTITYYIIKDGDNIIINVISPILSSGATRPTLSFNNVGFQFFDTSLNPQRPIWYKGNNVWVDANGTEV